MGLFSGSKKSTTITETQVTNLSQGFEDIQGPAVAGDSNVVSITSTDQGALDAALGLGTRSFDAAVDISRDAIDLGRSGLDSGERVAYAGLDNARAAQEGAFSFASDLVSNALDTSGQASERVSKFAYDVLGANSSLSRDALASQEGLATRAIDAVGDASSNVLDFAAGLFSEATKAQANLTDQNLAGLTSLAQQTSQTADDRITKVVMYALLAVAAVLILPRFAKGVSL